MAETIGEHREVDVIDGRKVCRKCKQRGKTAADLRALDCCTPEDFNQIGRQSRPAGWC